MLFTRYMMAIINAPNGENNRRKKNTKRKINKSKEKTIKVKDFAAHLS